MIVQYQSEDMRCLRVRRPRLVVPLRGINDKSATYIYAELRTAGDRFACLGLPCLIMISQPPRHLRYAKRHDLNTALSLGNDFEG